MSKNLLLLAKVLLKNGSNPSSIGKNKKIRSQYLIVGIIALCFAPLVISIVGFISQIYDILSQMGQEGVILSLGLSMSSFIIFFFGIFYIMNTFYFTNDIETLLPLPIKPYEILGAKFIVVTIFEYLTELVVLLPVLIVYGIKSGEGVMYYFYFVMIFLILPIIPLVVASIPVMIIMRFTTIARNKDRFRVIVGIIAIFFGLGANVLVQKSIGAGIDSKQLQQMLTGGKNSLIDITSKIFPTSKIAALSLINSISFNGFVNALFFIIVTAFVFLIFLYLGELLYFKGVMGISETSSRRKSLSMEELSRKAVHNSVITSYMWKEIKILFRTPPYFMNCVLMNFVWPVFFFALLLTRSKGSNRIEDVRKYLQDPTILGIVLTVASAIILFVAASNSVTASSISREGQQIFVNKYLPVSFKNQIMAKVLSGVFIGLIGMFSIMVVAVPVFKIPIYMVAGIIVVGLMAIFFSSLMGIVFDLLNPKLHWDNEQKAVKQNLNTLFNMFVGAAVAGLTILGVIKLELGLFWAFLGLVAVYAVLNAVLYTFLKKKGAVLFGRIED
jgi:ABC-2 type transport system permease protein